MNIDVQQLTINVNLHALQPEFRNLELHYIIAQNENTFHFADWQEMPGANEQKFYCFLQDKELIIPAGNVVLKESYVLTEEPVYPVIKDCKDFLPVIESVRKHNVAKAIRQFSMDALETIKKDLLDEFKTVETHVVSSRQLKHHLFVVDDVEISVAPTMVYFRKKAPFAEDHYHSATAD